MRALKEQIGPLSHLIEQGRADRLFQLHKRLIILQSELAEF